MAQMSLDAFQQCMMKSKLDEAAASPKGHSSPSPTQTQESDVPPESTDVALIEDQVGGMSKKAMHSAPKEMLKIHTVEEGQACLEEVQLINLEGVLDLNMLASTLVQISLFPGMSQVVRDTIHAVTLLMAQALPTNTGGTVAEEAVKVISVVWEDLLWPLQW